MSQKREIKLLLSTLIITAVILGGGYWLLRGQFGGETASRNSQTDTSGNSQPLPAKITTGDSILFSNATPQKQDAVQQLANGNYTEAQNLLNVSLKINPNDPEAVIYRNNAQLLANPQNEYYTIAVVVPVRVLDDQNKAAAILRGVAQMQTEINQSSAQINGKGLKVIIADDANSLSEAEAVAQELVNQEELIAVIGHYTSETTEAALPIYQENQVVLMSASSTSDTFSNYCRNQSNSCVFFRTIANNEKSVDFFSERLINNARRASLLYSQNSEYSQSFQKNFQETFPNKGGTVINLSQTDLSTAGFNPSQVIENAQQQGVEGLVLVPDGGTSAASLRNAIALIETNQGQLWMAGSSSLYNPTVLDSLQNAPNQTLNTLAIYTPWHYSNGCETPAGQQFCNGAQQLWGTRFVSWRTATAYDATSALTAGLKQLSPNTNNPQEIRQGLLNTLANPSFETQGATGIVAFDPNTHNRVNPPLEIVKVRQCSGVQYGLAFVPIEYNSTKEAGLSCS
ncbi:ABC transporter substrate-binding protein [Spirulina sp. CS-785/01]|uniref:ABC transporter substrate-binding protein n=1 Tax=Spirulina sp. CS-785/01 TaxID=3021716 RepID=UPI0023310DD5|nr:ABC transporter substrate-binding protein [Spirulina sp. CS-785/01]MDB9314794.1 ABC transporter substrate-binding protein [Spirulina sp. CS-785/01]